LKAKSARAARQNAAAGQTNSIAAIDPQDHVLLDLSLLFKDEGDPVEPFCEYPKTASKTPLEFQNPQPALTPDRGHMLLYCYRTKVSLEGYQALLNNPDLLWTFLTHTGEKRN